MVIYLVILLFVVIIVWNNLRYRVDSKNQYYILVCIFILLFLMITFRSMDVGTDYIHHYNSFIFSHNFSFIDDNWIKVLFNEPLWYSLFYLVNRLNFGMPVFWGVYFCILYFFLLRAIPQVVSKLLVVSIFILSYFYYASYNTSAQILAAILILCSVNEWNKCKKSKAVLYYIAAFLIHKSTLFVLPFFVLNYISISPKWYYIGFVVSFFFLFLGWDSFLFSNVNELLLLYDQSSNMSDYNKYFDMERSGLNIIGVLMNYVIIIANIVLYIICHHKEKKLDIYSQWWAIGIIIYILTFNYSWLFRLSYFFMMAMIIVIPKKFNSINKSRCELAIIMLSFIYVCKLYGNSDGIVPYELIGLLNI